MDHSPAQDVFTVAVTDPAGAHASATTDIIDNPLIETPDLYRLFDTATGDHFLTASATEKAALLAARPDLVSETNSFGHFLSGAAATIPVQRFFDTTNGTHFFTANTIEAASLQATRPDLVFESADAFDEQATAQPGDLPVYRFFNTANGTHLYVGDPNELAALTAAASPTYKPEGIAFFAPPGSYS